MRIESVPIKNELMVIKFLERMEPSKNISFILFQLL